MAYGKKLFICLVVLVYSALSDGRSWKRLCSVYDGSVVMLPAHFLTLDMQVLNGRPALMIVCFCFLGSHGIFSVKRA